MRKTRDHEHYYRGYWSEGGRCGIRIYREDGRAPVVVCSQLPDNANTSVTNMAEYLAAEVIEEHGLPTPLTWIEHYPEHEGESGKFSRRCDLLGARGGMPRRSLAVPYRGCALVPAALRGGRRPYRKSERMAEDVAHQEEPI